MPAKHTISHADELYRGNTYFEPYADQVAGNGRRGILIPHLAVIQIGAADADDANGIAESQTVTGAGTAFVLDGNLVTGGVATFDVPRNVVAAWTNTAVITITGTDEYGQVMVESSASGTSHTGKKAFKTITGITTSATITGATAGSGDVLGLPFRIAAKSQFVSLSADGLPEQPTFVVADDTTPTATTGDVRGTVAPATGPDGTVQFVALVALDASYATTDQFGIAQYAG